MFNGRSLVCGKHTHPLPTEFAVAAIDILKFARNLYTVYILHDYYGLIRFKLLNSPHNISLSQSVSQSVNENAFQNYQKIDSMYISQSMQGG